MLTIEFILEEKDYLEFYLYHASQSQAIKNRRFRAWITVTAALAGLAAVFYWDGNGFMTSYFVVLALLALFLYPAAQKSSYVKYVKGDVFRLLRENFGKRVRMVIDTAGIQWNGFAGENLIYYSALVEVVEVANYFFIPIKTGNAIIIPKFGIADIAQLENKLQSICGEMRIPYQQRLELTWSKQG